MRSSQRCPRRRWRRCCCFVDVDHGRRLLPAPAALMDAMMDIIQKLLAFLVVLSVLVVIHELGHYLVARWCGVKVLRFSVGFGRVIWSRRYGADRTEWAISLVPLGGYVK